MLVIGRPSRTPGQAVEQNRAQAEQVGRCAGCISARPLGRHIGGMVGLIAPAFTLGLIATQTGQQRTSIALEPDVLGADVAVHQIVGMDGHQRIRHRTESRDDLPSRQGGPGSQHGGQRAPKVRRHHDGRDIRTCHDVANSSDVLVPDQLTNGLFAPEFGFGAGRCRPQQHSLAIRCAPRSPKAVPGGLGRTSGIAHLEIRQKFGHDGNASQKYDEHRGVIHRPTQMNGKPAAAAAGDLVGSRVSAIGQDG